jgi:hypothetical protein
MPDRFHGSIKGDMKSSLLLLVATLACALAACASQPPAVNLSPAWPQATSDYEQTRERWARRDTIHEGLDHVMSVTAYALSPELRAAYVQEKAHRLALSEGERKDLITAEQAASADTIEFELLFSTNRADWNDLGKYPRTMWRIALVGDDGRVVLPTKILPDKRIRAEIEEWFPDLGPFYKPYIVTFPRVAADGKPVLGDGSKRMALEIGSAIGRAEMIWSAE